MEHLEQEDGPLVFLNACKLGAGRHRVEAQELTVSFGRSPHWIKSKNPAAPAVKRETEEEWG
jgi:hypothetical protein